MDKNINWSCLGENPFYLNAEEIEAVREQQKNMSEEEKIGQIFCGEVRAGEEEKVHKMIDCYGFGAVMCLPMERKEAQKFVKELQERSRIPLLVAGNFEDGAAAVGGHAIANNMQIGATKETEYAGKLGNLMAKEAGRAGINWAFAPVLDICMNWRNPMTGTRTFGSDADFVKKAGAGFIKAAQEEGVAAAMKHFPGDGVDERDQHFSPTVNTLSAEEWYESYGKVYRECIAAGAMTCMAGHIIQPALSKKVNPDLADEVILPASTSKELLQGILREELGFNGVISTDATTMAGFDQLLPREKALPMAVEAGCDMLLFCEDMDEDVNYIKHALAQGVLSKDRLDEAVMRILGLKKALEKRQRIQETVEEETDREALDLEAACADKAVTLVKDKQALLPLDVVRHKRICLYAYAEGRGYGSTAEQVGDTVKKVLEKAGFTVTVRKPGEKYPSHDEMIKQYDLILYALNMNSISNNAVCRINWFPSMGADAPSYVNEIPTLLVSFGSPYHLVDFPRVGTFVNAYRFSDVVVEQCVDKLLGKSIFTGESPVDPFCGFWDTRL